MVDQNIRDELIQILNARSLALVKSDVRFFEQILADDFCYTNASGKVFDKATYLEFFIESKQMRWQSQELDDLRIRLYDNIAVVTCRIHDRASYQGQEFDGVFRSTQVFSRQSGEWQYTVGQTTTIET